MNLIPKAFDVNFIFSILSDLHRVDYYRIIHIADCTNYSWASLSNHITPYKLIPLQSDVNVLQPIPQCPFLRKRAYDVALQE